MFLEKGYSGHADGMDNPSLQDVKSVGPIPRGLWTIGPKYDTHDHGPVVMRLTPDKTTNVFGRDGFLIHGNSAKGDASRGCIILSRRIREQIAGGVDKRLEVVA